MTEFAQAKTLYDPNTDVLYVGFGESQFTDEEEVSPGIHVLYAYDGKRLNDIVAIEIEYFKERFANSGDISLAPQKPFLLSTSSLA